MPPETRQRTLPRHAGRVGASVVVVVLALLAVPEAGSRRAEPPTDAIGSAPGPAVRAAPACRTRPPRATARPGVAVSVLARRGREPHGNLVVATSRPWVALTFDDGPWPPTTPAVLRTLRRFRAHATFFVVGLFASHYPGLLRRELAAGDDVANHTLDHHELTDSSGALRVDARALRGELRSGRDAICRAGVPPPEFFRPPYGRGLFNAEIAAQARRLNERMVGWDLAVDRYLLRSRTVSQAVSQVLGAVRPGTIILLHDGQVGESGHTGTLRALPLLLAGLRARGLRAVSLTRLLG